MTNVLDHLSSSTSFQTYMDEIGGSVNFEEEVCVQKNNLWREKVQSTYRVDIVLCLTLTWTLSMRQKVGF